MRLSDSTASDNPRHTIIILIIVLIPMLALFGLVVLK